jgi:hypothetical protein
MADSYVLLSATHVLIFIYFYALYNLFFGLFMYIVSIMVSSVTHAVEWYDDW